jgi:eukaryotic-like serine/threonine-protein kinase
MSQPARGLDEKIGPYQLVRAIGAGGSARIDLARIDRAYGFVRHVVIKRPLEHLRGDPGVAASLQREARIGGKLRHPNLVAVLDAGMHDGYDYLVLEYIQGTSLRELMQTETGGQVRTLPLAVGLGIVIDIARGLHDAHQLSDDRGEALGLVHRDISPANVLLGLDGSVKLADFGIAKETRVTTLSGSMHGTVTYMAPEQCRGHAFDRRADIWALGVILYELVTRQRLFWADNDVASLHKVLSGQVTRPRKLDPSLPTALEDIMMTALAQDPTARFPDARRLADALEAFAANQGLVVGARWIARAVEDFAGSRPAPWIPSTTVPDLKAIPEEPSLVDVIERDVEPDPEPLLPTFGVVDERALEEGLIPSDTTAPRRSRLIYVIGAAVVVGLGLGAVFALPSRPATTPEPRPIAPTVIAPVVHEAPRVVDPPPPPPSDESLGSDVIEAAGSGATSHPPAHRHHSHVTNPPPAGSNAEVASQPITEPDPEPAGSGAGSATKPAHVEWKPTMLLPTDSGKTKQP